MYYIIGDIHGYLNHLMAVMEQVRLRISDNDTLIFLGDYIDRGPCSYETIEYLINLSRIYNTVFLRGNHEDMLMHFINGEDLHGNYLYNGGGATIRSYENSIGSFILPESHNEFYRGLLLYFEGDDFIAVHAGLNPTIDMMENQTEHDLLWIRQEFYNARKRWDKTVIFGHTPTAYLSQEGVYFDTKRNIIALDSGVIMGGPLSCLTWPDRKIFRSTTVMS